MLNICSGKLHAHIISVVITCTKHRIFHELPAEHRLLQVIIFLSDVLVILSVCVCVCVCVWSLFLPWQELSIWARWALQINSSLGGTLTLCRHHWMGLSCLWICMKGKKKKKKITAYVSQILQKKWSAALYPLWQSKRCQWHLDLRLNLFPVTKVRLKSWVHSEPASNSWMIWTPLC